MRGEIAFSSKTEKTCSTVTRKNLLALQPDCLNNIDNIKLSAIMTSP